jgi:hypothetical protein
LSQGLTLDTLSWCALPNSLKKRGRACLPTNFLFLDMDEKWRKGLNTTDEFNPTFFVSILLDWGKERVNFTCVASFLNLIYFETCVCT